MIRKPASFRIASEWCADMWAKHPLLDINIGLAIGLAIHETLILLGAPLEEVDLLTRQGFYALLAQITSIIAVFTMASYGILLFRGAGSRLPNVMRESGESIVSIWVSAIRLPLLMLPIFLAAYLFDGPPDTGTQWEIVVLHASGLVAARTARLFWLFRYLLVFAVADAADVDAPPPALRDEYEIGMPR